MPTTSTTTSLYCESVSFKIIKKAFNEMGFKQFEYLLTRKSIHGDCKTQAGVNCERLKFDYLHLDRHKLCVVT
jgi:hypothetical protein